MFTRRRALDRRRHYTREFLQDLVVRLEEAGFDHITIVLPHNYSSVDPRQSVVPFDDFLRRERNFAAVILRAESSQKNELLKVLFVNSTARAVFVDDTFPMAQSEQPALFFQSPDPGRAYAVFEFFHDLLSQQTIAKHVLLTLGALAGLLVLYAEVLALVARRQGVLAFRWGLPAWTDFSAVAFFAWVIFRFYATPTGLWVKPKRELKLLYLANMALKGELRDNPLVQILMTIIGGVIVAYLARLFGWI